MRVENPIGPIRRSAEKHGHLFGPTLVCQYCPKTWIDFQRSPTYCTKGLERRALVSQGVQRGVDRREAARRARAEGKIPEIVAGVADREGVCTDQLLCRDVTSEHVRRVRRIAARECRAKRHLRTDVAEYFGVALATIGEWEVGA